MATIGQVSSMLGVGADISVPVVIEPLESYGDLASLDLMAAPIPLPTGSLIVPGPGYPTMDESVFDKILMNLDEPLKVIDDEWLAEMLALTAPQSASSVGRMGSDTSKWVTKRYLPYGRTQSHKPRMLASSRMPDDLHKVNSIYFGIPHVADRPRALLVLVFESIDTMNKAGTEVRIPHALWGRVYRADRVNAPKSSFEEQMKMVARALIVGGSGVVITYVSAYAAQLLTPSARSRMATELTAAGFKDAHIDVWAATTPAAAQVQVRDWSAKWPGLPPPRVLLHPFPHVEQRIETSLAWLPVQILGMWVKVWVEYASKGGVAPLMVRNAVGRIHTDGVLAAPGIKLGGQDVLTSHYLIPSRDGQLYIEAIYNGSAYASCPRRTPAIGITYHKCWLCTAESSVGCMVPECNVPSGRLFDCDSLAQHLMLVMSRTFAEVDCSLAGFIAPPGLSMTDVIDYLVSTRAVERDSAGICTKVAHPVCAHQSHPRLMLGQTEDEVQYTKLTLDQEIKIGSILYREEVCVITDVMPDIVPGRDDRSIFSYVKVLPIEGVDKPLARRLEMLIGILFCSYIRNTYVTPYRMRDCLIGSNALMTYEQLTYYHPEMPEYLKKLMSECRRVYCAQAVGGPY